jgi:hypothetical protein
MASTRLHRSEVTMLLGKLRRAHGITVTRRQVEAALGYPLAEASMDDLRGVIAGLRVVVDAAAAVPPTVLPAATRG